MKPKLRSQRTQVETGLYIGLKKNYDYDPSKTFLELLYHVVPLTDQVIRYSDQFTILAKIQTSESSLKRKIKKMDRLKRQANKYLLNPSFIFFNRNCPDNYTCIRGIGENPGRGYVSYDSFPQAFLTSLQVCTLDYWEIVFNSVSTRLKNFIFFFNEILNL